MKKKNLILECYSQLFDPTQQKEFDNKKMSKDYVEQLVNIALNELSDKPIIILGIQFNPADILKQLNPEKYNEYFDQYCADQNFSLNDDNETYCDNGFCDSSYDPDEISTAKCPCCGKEFSCDELDPDTCYCLSCTADEMENGPKEFRILPDDSEDTIIIKESCMKRWKKSRGVK